MRKGLTTAEWLMIVSIAFLCGQLLEKLTSPDYKLGQIDYANGIIKYELKQQANGESKWEEKK
jgi:hypothetical protein